MVEWWIKDDSSVINHENNLSTLINDIICDQVLIGHENNELTTKCGHIIV